MAEQVASSARRGLLKRAAVAGAALVGVAAGGGHALAAQPSETGRTLTLVGRGWHASALDKKGGDLGKGDRYTVYGELVDASGVKRGEFTSVCVAIDSPFQLTGTGIASIEMHTIALHDGAIFGMGVATGGPSTFAIVGGTGAYAGARGTYSAVQDTYGLGGSGVAELSLAITA